MEPLKKGLFTLKSLIEDVKREIVYETFEAIDDEYGSRYNAYQEIYRNVGIPVEKRYAIRINKVLLGFYRENLKKVFTNYFLDLRLINQLFFQTARKYRNY